MFYRKFIKPILFLFSPETIHRYLFFLFHIFPGLGHLFGRPVRRLIRTQDQSIEVFGFTFDHPVGLAGGMDKDGRCMHFFKNSGFSFIEVGTVTPKAQTGNPRPRLFRLPLDEALINRMGFNNDGVDALVRQLRKRPKGVIIGGNIGKNTGTPNSEAVEDYATCFDRLYGLVDYFVVNVSCPNISELAKLQNRDSLTSILQRVVDIRAGKSTRTPILLKVSPDLSYTQLDEVIEVVKLTRIDGIIATNTSIQRPEILHYSNHELTRLGHGGLSGKPLSERSTEVISYLVKALGSDFPIIASGGVSSADEALKKLEAGARLVQVYTGYIYRGPGFIREILKKTNGQARQV